MNYYENLLNDIDDRPPLLRHWPFMPATQADDEIARLAAHVSQLRKDNRGLRSLVRSLRLANLELQELVRKAAQK